MSIVDRVMKIFCRDASGGNGQGFPSDGVSRYSIVIMGPPGVGKTSLAEQFLFKGSQSDRKQTTASCNIVQKIVKLDGQDFVLDVLDVSHSAMSVSAKQRIMTNGDAFILVYSIHDEKSFTAVKEIRDEIVKTKVGVAVPIIIIGNKLDLSRNDRHIKRAIIRGVVNRKWGHVYVELSSKEQTEVERVFTMATRMASSGSSRMVPRKMSV